MVLEVKQVSIDSIVPTSIVADLDCDYVLISNIDGLTDLRMYDNSIVPNQFIVIHRGQEYAVTAPFNPPGKGVINQRVRFPNGTTLCKLLAPTGIRNVDIILML